MLLFAGSGARTAALAVAVAVCACSVVVNDRAADPTKSLDETVFRCNVEPVLARQCSYNACHGNPESALRVYSPGKLRAMPPRNIDDSVAPLSDTEHHANFESAGGIGFDTAIDDNWLLRKALPSADGGYEHKGGVIFAGKTDPQYVAIHDWLSGMGVCK